MTSWVVSRLFGALVLVRRDGVGGGGGSVSLIMTVSKRSTKVFGEREERLV